MRYLLDTNVCIDAMRGRRGIIEALLSLSPDDCGISTVSVFELEAGAHKSQRPSQELAKVRTFAETLVIYSWDNEAARASAKIRAALESAGMKIGAYDTLLAGHSLALGLTLVTDNTDEFGRVEGLQVENWRR